MVNNLLHRKASKGICSLMIVECNKIRTVTGIIHTRKLCRNASNHRMQMGPQLLVYNFISFHSPSVSEPLITWFVHEIACGNRRQWALSCPLQQHHSLPAVVCPLSWHATVKVFHGGIKSLADLLTNRSNVEGGWLLKRGQTWQMYHSLLV